MSYSTGTQTRILRTVPPIIAVIGTAKNVGKTTALLSLSSAYRRLDRSVLVASIGRDGETADAIGAHRKPPIELAIGDWVVTTDREASKATTSLELVESLGTSTVLGRPSLWRAATHGTVTVSGLRFTDDLARLSRCVDRTDSAVVLVDGGFDRVAAANAAETTHIVLATGAAAGSANAAIDRLRTTIRELRRAGSLHRLAAVAVSPWHYGSDGKLSSIPLLTSAREACDAERLNVPVFDSIAGIASGARPPQGGPLCPLLDTFSWES